MAKSAPVTLPARSLARNRTRSATSSGLVNRPVTIWLAAWRCTPPGSAPLAAPRADRVHPDALGPDFLRQRLGEAGERGLGRAVVHHARVRQVRVDRAGADDRARSRGDHLRQRGAG